MDPKIIGAFGLLCLCSISSSIAASMGGGEEKEDPVVPKTPVKTDTDAGSDADAGADAGAGAGADAADLPGQVSGYSVNYASWKNIPNTPTPEDCRLEAAKEGIPTFIHRNSTHGGSPNTCQLNVWGGKYAGNMTDTVHTQGCTYGGTPENGCTPWPSVMGYKVPGRVGIGDVMGVMNPNECIELGKEKGADVWGYRTKNHGSNPNSCFFFTGTSAYAGDDDSAHIVGCINGKDIKYGCA
jgi:hypothetical protein